MNEQVKEVPLLLQRVNKIEIAEKRKRNSSTNRNVECRALNGGGEVHIVVNVYYVAVNVMQMRQNTHAKHTLVNSCFKRHTPTGIWPTIGTLDCVCASVFATFVSLLIEKFQADGNIGLCALPGLPFKSIENSPIYFEILSFVLIFSGFVYVFLC